MKLPIVKSLKSGLILGALIGFGLSEKGERFAIVKAKSRAMSVVIEVTDLATNYEVINE